MALSEESVEKFAPRLSKRACIILQSIQLSVNGLLHIVQFQVPDQQLIGYCKCCSQGLRKVCSYGFSKSCQKPSIYKVVCTLQCHDNLFYNKTLFSPSKSPSRSHKVQFIVLQFWNPYLFFSKTTNFCLGYLRGFLYCGSFMMLIVVLYVAHFVGYVHEMHGFQEVRFFCRIIKQNVHLELCISWLF